MALKDSFNFRGLDITDGYHKITGYRGNKDGIDVFYSSFTSKESSDNGDHPISSGSISMDNEESGINGKFFGDLYSLLKTNKFPNATDV